MNLFGEIIKFLDARMSIPGAYGWFHILFITLSIAFGIFLCLKFKNPSEKTVRRIVLIITLVVIALEIYKQFNYSFSFDGEKVNFDYQWYAFPFQFCSSPMYVGLMAGIFKGRIHRAASAFLATFATFAGLAVMIYPNDVFIDTIGINIQTMVCHGSMLSIGIFLLGSGYVRSNLKSLLSAVPIFSAFVVTAMILNEIAYVSGLLLTETFNMFYISPHCDPSLPVYSMVQGAVPYPWCLFIYIIGFSLAAGVIIGISALLHKIFEKKEAKTA